MQVTKKIFLKQLLFSHTGFDQFETSMFHFDDLPKVPKDRKILTFRVKAAADAHIALISDKEDKDNMYEICKYKILTKAPCLRTDRVSIMFPRLDSMLGERCMWWT